jgi:aldehyde:ferredoxin oxidoreductase
MLTNYVTIYKAVTGRPFDKHRLIEDSERVCNFQRVFNLRRGYGTRKYDAQPYRAAGPVTVEEYESRAERYDKELIEKVGVDIKGMTTEQKMKLTRQYREKRYEDLLDAVYKRRGWNKNGVPTLEHLRKLGIDFPEVVEVVKPYQI